MVETGLIPLADAHALYTDSGGTTPLSSWQKRSREYSNIEIGRCRQFAVGSSTRVQTEKIGGRWCMDEQSFTVALNEMTLACAEVRSTSELYEQRQLRGDPGQRVETTWGYYIVSSPFHERINPIAAYHRGSGSQHVCNECWVPASYEHNRPECHRCRDWTSCGGNCTRSAMTCPNCSARLVL